MEEQGFLYEFDDFDDAATHIVLYEDGLPVAVCRLIPGEDGLCCTIGRVAVVEWCRGRSLGRAIIDEAERRARLMGFRAAMLSAQVRAKGFYESCGYSAFGDEYYEEWCPHVMMRKDLSERVCNGFTQSVFGGSDNATRPLTTICLSSTSSTKPVRFRNRVARRLGWGCGGADSGKSRRGAVRGACAGPRSSLRAGRCTPRSPA